MSPRSLVRFWRSRSTPRRRSALPRRKVWLEVLEDRTMPAGGLGLVGGAGLSTPGTMAPNNTVQVLPPETPLPFDPATGTGNVSAAALTVVTRLYDDLLHRNPQASEVASWAAALDAGQSRGTVALGFTQSDEYHDNLIRADYRALLGRDPGSGEVAGWLSRLQTGLSEEQLTALILGSQEFYQQQGGTAVTWLTGVYGVELGRAPDATGFTFWLNVLQAGAPREAVAYLLVSSSEGRALALQDTYQGLLRRDAEGDGVASWEARLDQGQSLEQVVASIAASDEYAQGSGRTNTQAAHTILISTLATPQGRLSNNATLTANTLLVQGGGAPGEPVIIAVDGVATTRARITPSGGLSVQLSQLPDPGLHQITVRPLEGSGAFAVSNSVGINVDASLSAVKIQPPGLEGTSTPTLTVNVNPTPVMSGALTVAIDVDLNHDGNFSDPGEQNFAQASVQAGTNTIPLGSLDAGGYLVRARLDDALGNESVSGLAILGVNPKGRSFGGNPTTQANGSNQGGSSSTSRGGAFRGMNGSRVSTQSSGSAADPPTLSVGANVNAAHALGNQSEPAIAVDPTNPSRLFMTANSNNVSPGLFASYSTDGGQTWISRMIADGTDGLPAGFSDPSLSWDQFGNLFFVYIDATATSVIVTLSTDGGVTFRAIAQLTDPAGKANGQSADDQPTVTTGAGTIWISTTAVDTTVLPVGSSAPQAAAGAHVTGLGQVGSFSTLETVPNSGPLFGDFGDIAIGPKGQVVVAYQSALSGVGPDQILVSVDPDGLGLAGFGTPVVATATNVGGFRPIPAQSVRTVDAEASLAYDTSGGPHNGRVYLIYSDAPSTTSDDLNTFSRFSDDDGKTWSSPVRVNDDLTSNSQFNPRAVVDPTTGVLGVSWYDCRNDPGSGPGDTDKVPNTDVEEFATVSVDGGLSFLPNMQVAQEPSNSNRNHNNSNDYGDYSGLAFFGGVMHPAWVDNSRDLPFNPNQTAFDIATAAVTVLGVATTSGTSGGVGGGGTSPVALADDRFDPNDTSDQATNFGSLSPGTQTVAGLSIGRHANGLPDADWFRYSASTAGTVTVTINYQPVGGGDLDLRVFTLDAQNTLINLGSSLNSGVTSQSVSVRVTAGEPILIWVFGADFAQANYTLTVTLQ